MKFLFVFVIFLTGVFTIYAEDANKKDNDKEGTKKKEILTSDNSDASKKLLENLGKPVSKAWNTSLNDVCKDISTQLDVKIEIDKAANSEGAIELTVNGMSGTNVIKWVLSIKGCVGKVKEGVLYITLAENK